MRVIVLGAGVVGVTTACYLAKRGIQVTVVERADRIANGASYANAGQLSYSFTDALAGPGMPGKLPGLLLGTDPAIRIRPPLDAEFIRWAIEFMRQCTRQNFRANTLAVLRLAAQSSCLMEKLLQEFDIDFSFCEAGKLVLLRSRAEVAAAEKSVELKVQHGADVRLLGIEEAVAIEPALLAMREGYTGAVYSAGDHVGDARSFSTELASSLVERYGVEFHLGTDARNLLTTHGRVAGVQLPHDELKADAVVVCLGAWSQKFLGPSTNCQPIVPVRGYSVTLPPGRHPPRVSISDVEHRIVFSSLNSDIRIAGFADFIGFNNNRDAMRIETLLRVARKVAPEAADYDARSVRGWGGFRPMTATSQPIVGPTSVPGLFLNCGHGMLGWTLACATGSSVAGQIAG
jgi:D-amino-acid dehydrogenase